MGAVPECSVDFKSHLIHLCQLVSVVRLSPDKYRQEILKFKPLHTVIVNYQRNVVPRKMLALPLILSIRGNQFNHDFNDY